MMYRFLASWLPSGIASVATGLWYAILILLTLIFAFEPQAEFRYIGM